MVIKENDNGNNAQWLTYDNDYDNEIMMLTLCLMDKCHDNLSFNTYAVLARARDLNHVEPLATCWGIKLQNCADPEIMCG